MSRFIITDLPLAGLKRIQRQRMGDSRGFIGRLFCGEELAAAGWQGSIAQVNHSYTCQLGTVRGLHFQRSPHEEAKLVSCLHGEVWDVVVDLRKNSPTFLSWHAERLSAENLTALFIPKGFAHGYQTLTNDVELLYCHSTAHSPSAEGGLNPRDPTLGIHWPIEIAEISIRDKSHPMLDSRSPNLEL